MRNFAQISLSIWNDDDFRTLPVAAQHLYFVILCHPTMTQCGVIDWRPNRVTRFSDEWTIEEVEQAASVLVQKLYIVIDEDTEECLVRSFMRNNGVLGHPNRSKGMVKDFRKVVSSDLRGVIVHELNRVWMAGKETSAWGDWLDELLHHPAVDPQNLTSHLDANSMPSRRQVDANSMPSNCHRDAESMPTRGGTSGDASEIGTRKGERGTGKREHAQIVAQPSGSSERERPDPFDEFWDACPRKVGKQKARAKFTAAVKRANGGAQTVIDGMRRLAGDPNLPEKRFIPHPATWLERDGWEDEPLPDRHETTEPTGYRMEDWLREPPPEDPGDIIDGEVVDPQELEA